MRSVLIPILLFLPSLAVAQERLTLAAALETAQAQNESRQITEQRVERARALKRETLASMLPNLSVGAGGTYNGVAVELNGRSIVQQFDWGANARAAVTVFDGSLYPLYSASSRSLEASAHDAEWTLHMLSFEVEQSFFALAAAERQLQIAERALELRKAYTDRAMALAEQGIALQLDASRARAQQLDAEQAVLEATASLGNASDALGVLLGTTKGEEFRSDVSTQKRPQPPQAAAVVGRDDIRAYLKRIEGIELRESAVWWGLLPSVELSANSRFGPASLSNPDGFVWSVSLDATWLLYDGGARYARAAGIAAEAEEARLMLSLTRRQVGAEARRTVRDWSTAHQAIEVATKKLEVAQATYDMVLGRYEAGLATSIEVTQASEDLYLAELNLNAAELAADLAESQYRFVIGVSE
jgi:outer membrane protein TolC